MSNYEFETLNSYFEFWILESDFGFWTFEQVGFYASNLYLIICLRCDTWAAKTGLPRATVHSPSPLHLFFPPPPTTQKRLGRSLGNRTVRNNYQAQLITKNSPLELFLTVLAVFRL